ncbi:MAG: DNA alkylation repair protein [Cyanobacteria bacterium P01_E01_bin.6]
MNAEGLARKFVTNLKKHAKEETKSWWESYLKGEASFRGVKMADVRASMNSLWNEQDLHGQSPSELLLFSQTLMSKRYTEDKLGGVLLLSEKLLQQLTIAEVPMLAEPLENGSLADWNVVDWYGVKVVGPFITAGQDARERAKAISLWKDGCTIWKRRCSAIAFTRLAAKPDEHFKGFHELLMEICRTNVADPVRWSQTSVGWLLRELSRNHPDLVRRFLSEHPELSKEARRNALKYL